MNKLHKFLESVPKIPNPYASELIDSISESLTFQLYPAHRKFYLEIKDQKMCYVVRKGMVENIIEDNGRLLNINLAPTIVGNLVFSLKTGVYIRTLCQCEIAILTYDELIINISEKGLWELYARYLQVINHLMYQYALDFIENSAYALIKSQLKNLMKEPDIVRRGMTAERYIREKTNLSRSGIISILSKLKAGGYIMLDKGKLIDVIKLPHEF